MVRRAHEHWQRDVDFELHRRWRPQGDGIFIGWHNLELFSLPLRDRVSSYVSVPSWWASYEVLHY